jgi:hypothetical protein
LGEVPLLLSLVPEDPRLLLEVRLLFLLFLDTTTPTTTPTMISPTRTAMEPMIYET